MIPSKAPLAQRLLHPVSLIGLGLAIPAFIASMVLLGVDLLESSADPYRGLLTFVLFPAILLFGLGLAGLGLFFERRRRRRLEKAHIPWRPSLDLSKRRDRAILTGIAGVVILFAIGSLIGGMRAYEFTESVEFCGEVCHAPMGPQLAAYLDSPHAEVECVECHVGPGIDNYVNAKLAGMHQLWAMVTGEISRPIVAPREKLLPANATCEHCHWRGTFFGLQIDQRVRYGYDLKNTRRPVRILMKIGGRDATGEYSGIHWHMSVDDEVWFRATDESLMVIPWVEVRRADGTRTVYRDESSPMTDEAIEALEMHRMDCLDCHSRPAHHIATPEHAVDKALEDGAIDGTLPSIKKVLVAALSREYPTQDVGAAAVRREILAFYSERFGGKVLERKEPFDRAVAAAESIYRRNVFPEMRLDGFTHADHIGHREFPGCFRCHAGKHVAAAADAGDAGPRRIDSDCALCHTFVEGSRAEGAFAEIPADASSFHPWKDQAAHAVACSRCHTGATSPYNECQSCHPKITSGHAGENECSICHHPGGEAVGSTSCAACHPAGGSPMHVATGHGDCLACHKPHEWKASPQEGCETCHPTLAADHPAGKECGQCHDFGKMSATWMGLPAGKR